MAFRSALATAVRPILPSMLFASSGLRAVTTRRGFGGHCTVTGSLGLGAQYSAKWHDSHKRWEIVIVRPRWPARGRRHPDILHGSSVATMRRVPTTTAASSRLSALIRQN